MTASLPIIRPKRAAVPASEQRELREALLIAYSYDPETGVFHHKVGRRAGKVAGCNSDGYLIIKVQGRNERAHRMAWLAHYGVLPETDIDHINRSRSDNRIVNLRESARWENSHNTGIRGHNTSGFKGVSFNYRDKRWAAEFRLRHARYFGGCHDTAEKAARAYDALARKHLGEFAVTNASLGLLPPEANLPTQPLAIDLFCGLGGWTEGLLSEGYRVIGFDIEAHEYGEERYPAQLVLQDVLTLHGSQFRDAALIVASPPCQEFSYMAMPWRRAKQIARALRGQDAFPERYRGSRTIADMTALFDACFRIQREACEAAGRHIPMVVENVRGAQPWVGNARWSWGSYYLWGDVPALMPRTIDSRKNPGFRFDGSGKSFQSESVERHVEGRKRPGLSLSEEGFNVTKAREIAKTMKRGSVKLSAEDRRQHLSGARKAASAKIAKIPLALSSWIAKTYRPPAPILKADAA